MPKYFIPAKSDAVVRGWPICWTGQDAQGNHYNVATNQIHASELYKFSRGADGDAELIARLLNWYYSDKEAAEAAMNGKAE